MSVIRYLMATLATIMGALVLGGVMGFSMWQNLAMAVCAVVFLQMLILAYVVVISVRATRATRKDPSKRTGKLRRQLFILPK